MLRQILIPFLIVASGVICLEYFIPIAVGEFLAGMVGELIFGVSKTPWLQFLSHLGLISIMFLAGFEIDLKVLRQNSYKSFVVGGISFFAPFMLILLLSSWLKMPFSQAAVMGIALSTTSLAIVFPALRERDFLESEDGQLLLASAMVVDIISMLTLSLFLGQFSLMNLFILVPIIVGFFFIKRIVLPVFARYKGNRSEFELKFLFLLLLSFGFLAEVAGLHEAVISFILGVLFSDIDPEHELIMNKLSSVVFSLLAPAFFFQAGAMIQITEINFYVVGLSVIFLFFSVLGKSAGTYFLLRLFSCRLAKYGGIIFNYRLSFGLVTALYGLEQKIITSEIFNTILLCVLFSSLIATYFEKSRRFTL